MTMVRMNNDKTSVFLHSLSVATDWLRVGRRSELYVSVCVCTYCPITIAEQSAVCSSVIILID